MPKFEFENQQRARQSKPSETGTEDEGLRPRRFFNRQNYTTNIPAEPFPHCISSPPHFILPYGVSGSYEFFSSSRYTTTTGVEERVPESSDTTAHTGSIDETEVLTEDMKVFGADTDAEDKEPGQEVRADHFEERPSEGGSAAAAANKKLDEKKVYEFVKAKHHSGKLLEKDVMEVAAYLRSKVDNMDREKAKMRSEILTLEQRQAEFKQKVVILKVRAFVLEQQEAKIQQENAVYNAEKAKAEAVFEKRRQALDAAHEKRQAANKAKLDEVSALLEEAMADAPAVKMT